MFSRPWEDFPLPSQWCLAHLATPTKSLEFQTYLRQQSYELNSDMHYTSDSIHAPRAK